MHLPHSQSFFRKFCYLVLLPSQLVGLQGAVRASKTVMRYDSEGDGVASSNGLVTKRLASHLSKNSLKWKELLIWLLIPFVLHKPFVLFRGVC